MNRLLEIGFEPAGHWLLKGDDLQFELSRHSSQRNILYAFVCDGEVMYVGKTTQTLYARIGGYKRPGPTQSTNIRNNSRIRAVLESGSAVDILALPDNGLLHYGQFHLNLAAGLEDSLIAIMSPPWNRSTTTPDVKATEPDAEEPDSEFFDEARDTWSASTADSTELRAPPIASFTLTVQPTYYRQGFFNVGVDNDNLLGTDGQEIEIFCGGAEQPIIGTINRTANKNHTPRIMGGTGLRNWFHRSLEQMEQATIYVLSPTAIRIEAKLP